MGILALHVPTIEQLQPGVVEVIEENGVSNKFFGIFLFFSFTLIYSFVVSGGFATMQPSSDLYINAIEAYPLDDFSLEVNIIYIFDLNN